MKKIVIKYIVFKEMELRIVGVELYLGPMKNYAKTRPNPKLHSNQFNKSWQCVLQCSERSVGSRQ